MASAIHDPVCGLRIEEADPRIERAHAGTAYRFCSERCAERFAQKPERYLGEPLIRLRGVEKTFGAGEGATHVLRGIDLNIWEGDFVSLVGASGSGKSTVLNLIGNLDKATAGEIRVRGQDLSTLADEERARLRSRTFGFVFQQYNLIPWLSALENVLTPVIFAGKDRHAHLARLTGRLTAVDMGHRLSHRPAQLSGGEQQRVALIRALANDPEIILGDEPTGNLDSATGEKILAILKDLHAREKKTLVIVTHDSSIAAQADHVIVLKDGRVVRAGAEHRGLFAH